MSNHLPVGMVVTDWLSFSLYRMAVEERRQKVASTAPELHLLVFPAASRPNINNLISLFPKIFPAARLVSMVPVVHTPRGA